MSRFAALYQHFEDHVGKILKALPGVELTNFVFVYQAGIYRAYVKATGELDPRWEVNPAACLSYEREVWFYYGRDGLEAYVDYQPEFRDKLFIPYRDHPLIRLAVDHHPAIAGWTH